MCHSGFKLIFLLCYILYVDIIFSENVSDRCKDNCQSLTSYVGAGSADQRHCDQECSLAQCSAGCELWDRALNTSCLEACTLHEELLSIQVALCVSGCNYALDLYIKDKDVLLSNLSSPVLVAGSKTNETVILGWERPLVSNVTYVLQKLYVNLSEEWEQHPITWRTPRKILIKDLHPYVTYKFRIVVVVSPQHTVISPESVPIATKDSGAPSGVPVILSLSTSSTSIHLKWKPPYFVNAQLLGYKLTIYPLEDPVSGERMKEVAAHGNEVVSEVITLLRPDTQYMVEVAARNRYGIGPTVERLVKTKPRSAAAGTTPYLVMGSDSFLNAQNLEDISPYTDRVIYQLDDSTKSIKGVAMHYENKILYFVDSIGAVWKLILKNSDAGLPEVNHSSSSDGLEMVYLSENGAEAMSVDWLNNFLYIAERNQISRCFLGDGRCIASVVISNLSSRPEDISVDPCNGYLFWVQQGDDGGLYRVDLADLELQVALHSPTHLRIVNGDQMTAFTVDYPNFRILFPNETRNSLMSVYLDGTDLRDIRKNMEALQFIDVKSMALYNGMLCWVTGQQVTVEEYDPNIGQYRHNPLYIDGHSFTGLHVWHPSTQPLPVPLMPPKDLEVLFSVDSATISWQKPEVDQGRGAWHSWLYEVEEVNHRIAANQTFSHITKHSLTVRNLRPEQLYSFRARAYSEGGYGPWSMVVNGTTLLPDSSEPYILFVDETEVQRLLVDGSGQTLKYNLSLFNSRVIDVETYADLSFFTLQNGSVLMKDSSGGMRVLPNIHIDIIYGTQSTMAYDWVAKTLYWSSPKHNMIQRVLLDFSTPRQPETIHQGASAIQDIALDSAQGFIYWTTCNTIEMSRLSGRGHAMIQNIGRFTGRYIFGLAMDLAGGYLYWMMKERKEVGETLTIFKMPLLNRRMEPRPFSLDNRVEAEYSFTSPASHPSLHYYSHKLFWVSDYNVISVWDLRGKNVAKLRSQPQRELTSFTIVHDGKGHRPGSNSSGVDLIPPPVNLQTIRMNGKADNFTVSWSPVVISGDNQVYYKVEIHAEDHPARFYPKVFVPVLPITYMEPYTNFTLTITPCSDWACNDSSSHMKVLRSPESVPSVPTRPRKFVTYHRQHLSRDINIEVEFRWSRPENMNGELKEYIVTMTSSPSGPWRMMRRHRPRQRYETIQNASPNTTYYFKVCACTSLGCSDYSSIVEVNTSDEKPVPMLLALDSNMLRVFYVDNKNYTDLAKGHVVLSLAYIAQEGTFYWIDDTRSGIIKLDGFNGSSEERVVETDSPAKSLTADWIGRNLYWLEDKPSEENSIMKYSLSQDNAEVEPIIKRRTPVWQIAVDPYHSSLFWTETRNNTGFLMKCRVDGSAVRTIVWHNNGTTSSLQYKYKNEDRLRSRKRMNGRRRSRRDLCNCPELSVSEVFILDHTIVRTTELYVVDNNTGSIWATDADGCVCRLVVDSTGETDLGLPPDSLTVDLDRLYWTNKKQASVNSVLKKTGGDFVKETTGNAPTIMAYGEHLQPMPDPTCLLVGNYTDVPRVIETTNTSLSVDLPPWRPDSRCEDISLPAIKYTLLYRIMEGDNDLKECGTQVHCYRKGSYVPEITLNDLWPDTLYQVQALVSNIYTKEPNWAGRYGMFRTKIGIPSEPQNVQIDILNPFEVDVLWQPPEHLNGPRNDVNYAVDWYTVYSNGTRKEYLQDVQRLASVDNDGQTFYFTKLSDLQPGQLYYAKVRAYDKNRTGYSESQEVECTTYSLPGELHAKPINASVIELEWVAHKDSSVLRHVFEKSLSPNDSQFESVSNIYSKLGPNVSVHTERVTGLRANTRYYFQVLLVYRKNRIFRWPRQAITAITPIGPPSPPDAPKVKLRGDETEIYWNIPYSGGASIESYILEFRPEDTENETWTQLYNNSATYWKVTGLTARHKYMFRVAAVNMMGVSDFNYSEVIEFPHAGLQGLTVILASSFGAVMVIIFIAVIFLIMRCRHFKEQKQVLFSIVPGQGNSPDLELATLRELPRVTVQTSNALYTFNKPPSISNRPKARGYSRWKCDTVRINGIIPTDEDIAALPHFRRDHLTLTKFLGSGAFGEVFEGIANNILSCSSGDTRVAVKTLRKGATDQEKEEFLKEALLMSNFKYNYILRLLGVCLDNDPQFIILELMEGGDLLSYLRTSRNTPTMPAKLNLPDMVGICVDVSMGCRYLEDMHFVHRDLAARNCLVSSRNPQLRVVKIGDFGLARDIYKNDYYRKEGEGLLPVRWMSPESLIDGVFTTQSDVWAFGVLMWEVLTLGQQPYPARTNLEVLHFVRSGGRLDRPDNCPDDLYNLMLKCWSYNPEERPSFSYILSQLEGFKRRSFDPTSEFSGRNGDVESCPPACPPILYEDERRLRSQINSRSPPKLLSHDIIGITGLTVKLPPLNKHDSLKDTSCLSDDSASSFGSNKGDLQDGSVKNTSPHQRSPHGYMTRGSNGLNTNRDNDSGYLEPVALANTNHKYLDLFGSKELSVSPREKNSLNTSTNNNTYVSPSENSGSSLEGATSPPPGVSPESEPWLRSAEHKNGYSQSKPKSMASKDPKSGKTILYAELAQSSMDGDMDKASESQSAAKPAEVRSPYRGTHSKPWVSGASSNVPAVRDIAGRSVPPPPQINKD